MYVVASVFAESSVDIGNCASDARSGLGVCRQGRRLLRGENPMYIVRVVFQNLMYLVATVIC
jgi:hypothetical protein